MRLIATLLLATLAAGAAPVHAAETYDALVRRAQSGDTALDYRALRDAYALSARYQPEGGDFDEPRGAMLKAFSAGDCTTALPAAAKVLNAIFIDISAHLISGRCFELAADAAKAGYHRAIARGLMTSILDSGDGKSPKTAFVVVTVGEEYDVLTALRLHLVLQSLVRDDGHSYDKMDAKAAAGGQTATLYFQIDRPMAWLSHALEH